MSKRMFTIRAPENELEILTLYAAQTRRTKTEIVREFLRSLERRLERPVPAQARARTPTKPSTKRPRP
jgi:hypothetical protein